MDNVEVKYPNSSSSSKKKRDPPPPTLDGNSSSENWSGALAAEVERGLSIRTVSATKKKGINGLVVNGLSEKKCCTSGKQIDIDTKQLVQDSISTICSSNCINEESNPEERTKASMLNDNNKSEAKMKEDVSNKSLNVSYNDRNEDSNQTSVVENEINYVQYESELQMPMIMKIIQKDLSEPYSIYTYRYFIHNWPKLCFLAMCKEKCVGAIVCKLDIHRKTTRRGYIAMLAVDKDYRKRSIGSTLVRRAIEEMIAGDADEVVLETEVTNEPALKLYGALGFVRDKRLFRYYLNGVDALRLKLWLR